MKAQEKGIQEIKHYLTTDRIIIGSLETLKALKQAQLETIYLASNCKPEIEADIVQYSPLSGTQVVKLPVDNNDLGTSCKKPFSISVIGIKKG